jgi:hypothetical protein
MTDPLTLVFMALSAVTSGLLFLFRQLMVEKDKSFTRLENDCEKSQTDIKEDNKWLRGQLEELQRNQMSTLNVISKAIDTQGVGVNIIGTGVQSILDMLKSTMRERDRGPGPER